MEYFYSIKDTHNFTHSIDNVCVSYYLKCSLDFAVKYLHERGCERKTYYENLNKTGCSKWSFFRDHIHYDDGIYILLGKYKIWLEKEKRAELLPIIQFQVNPNKHCEKESFKDIIVFIKSYCTNGQLDKYDYAIDVPVALCDIQVFGTRKEKGLYKGTRYYGQRNKHGYCKIYDKGKEQNLSDNLTRIEHTIVNGKDLSLEKFYVRSSDSISNLDELPASTRVYVELCLEIKQLGGDFDSIISKLDRHTVQKIYKYLSGGYFEFEYDKKIIDILLEKISDLFQIGYTDANGFMHVLDEELPFD